VQRDRRRRLILAYLEGKPSRDEIIAACEASLKEVGIWPL
jgi:hypothetical protein